MPMVQSAVPYLYQGLFYLSCSQLCMFIVYVIFEINLSRRVSDVDGVAYGALEVPAALCCAEVDVALVLFERSRDSE